MNKLPSGRKRGRPPSETLRLLQELRPYWSERTCFRYLASLKRFLDLGATHHDVLRMLDAAHEANKLIITAIAAQERAKAARAKARKTRHRA